MLKDSVLSESLAMRIPWVLEQYQTAKQKFLSWMEDYFTMNRQKLMESNLKSKAQTN